MPVRSHEDATMSMGNLDSGGRAAPMAEINTTPLVDVMLVLLIIFIITAPLFTHAVKIDMPQASSQPNPEEPDAITLALDAEGRLFWNDEPIDEAALKQRLGDAARREPQPELQLRVDKATRYERLAAIMSAAQSKGIGRLGFVTLPERQ
jgi:biopolymer transport protein ExbD